MRTTCLGRWLFLLSAFPLAAERLPVHRYTAADGLLMDGAILRIMQDSQGFLWFTTPMGLSRFDGRSFRSYGAEEGVARVEEIVETAPGQYWVATDQGLARYDPSAPPGKRFPIFHVNGTRTGDHIHAVSSDGRSGLWIGTNDGLYHAMPGLQSLEARLVLRPEIPLHSEPVGYAPVMNLMLDSSGTLWVTGHYGGIYRVLTSGAIEHYTSRDGLPYLNGGPFLEDRAHRVWLGTAEGLLQLKKDPKPGDRLVLRSVDTTFGLREQPIRGICETADGRLWMASTAGLLEFDGVRLRRYTRANGLSQSQLWSVISDRRGALWVGSGSAGVMRISRGSFTTFDEADGISDALPRSVLRTSPDDLVAITGDLDHFLIHRWDGARFQLIQPRFAPGTKFGWGIGQILLRDREGETWLPTYDGLARFPRTASIAGLNGLAPTRIYTMRDGFSSRNIHKLFEDSRGDIWVGLMFPPGFGLARWRRATDRIEDLSTLPDGSTVVDATAFAESADGAVWVGFDNGMLRRFSTKTAAPFGNPALNLGSSIESLTLDSSGHIWGTAYHAGLFRIDNAESDAPRATLLDSPQRAAESLAICVTADRAGRIYTGTYVGLNRLDPATGESVHFDISDGLPNNQVMACATDAEGQLWFATPQGVSRLAAPSSDSPPPGAVRIMAVEAGGRTLPLSDLGVANLAGFTFDPGQSRVQIQFAAIDFSGRRTYRYKLDGAGRDWSQPTTQQTVEYPYLPPGKYRFLAEAGAIAERGQPPASFTFLILPPLWQRWWFVSLACGFLMASAYTAYRYRLAQLLRVERVRTGIAADLHDDIGSALTHIALLSDLARRQTPPGTLADSLDRIANVSRDTTAAMSDIVWSINPQRDSLGDLAVRVRRFAVELASAREIECEVNAVETDLDLRLTSETRRQLLLVAKEGIQNAVRHSRCANISIQMKRENGAVLFRIDDDGVGFDADSSLHGHGLGGMRSRAVRLGGSLTIERLNPGTRLQFRIPV
jgi:ligand-binding sensor domain-containing protein/two-component sensor histidine kinase